MNDNLGIQIKIRITDPWDSTDVIIGRLKGEVFVDDLKGAVIYSEKREWLVLLPRHKGQDLLAELINGQEAVTNIAWLSNQFHSTMKQITGEYIAAYSSGSAVRLESP